MPELIFHGLRASYRTWGSGADVALLHAGGSSSVQWTDIAETLVRVAVGIEDVEDLWADLESALAVLPAP